VPVFEPVVEESNGVILPLVQMVGVVRDKMMFEEEIISGEVKRWVEEDGEKFLHRIGLKEGDRILDFGCGEGHYTIPAARVVGRAGVVYAFDKDKSSLDRLQDIARHRGVDIKIMHGDTYVPLEDNSLDMALCYDVIHYMHNRKLIYNEIWRLLKEGGIFSLYPKHCHDDYPLMELADTDIDTILDEVTSCGFSLIGRLREILLHDDYYNEGQILNFRKGRQY